MTKDERRERFEDIYHTKIGMCSCGDPEAVKNLLYDLLDLHAKYREEDNLDYESYASKRDEIIKQADPLRVFEFIFHVLENADLLEHGSSIHGSWLTGDGWEFLDLLKEFKDEEQ